MNETLQQIVAEMRKRARMNATPADTLLNEYADRLERLSASEAAREWRPIETAPKDGTRVLLAWGNLTVHGFWLDNSNTRIPWAGWRVGSMEVEPRGHVTHWMPIPSPPKATP